MGVSQWGLSFFAFSEKNLHNIHKSIFALAEHGLPPNYLLDVPVDIFYYYIDLYNKKGEAQDAAEAHARAKQAQKDNTPHPVGSSIPRKN